MLVAFLLVVPGMATPNPMAVVGENLLMRQYPPQLNPTFCLKFMFDFCVRVEMRLSQALPDLSHY